MRKHYAPKDIGLFSLPITAANRRNGGNHPATELGACTPSQLLESIHTVDGPICVIGNCNRGLSLARALIRRSRKPFLLIGPSHDRQSALSALNPTWTSDAPPSTLPSGDGAVWLSKPHASYLELCEYFEEWSETHFLLLHLSGGVRVGPELLDLLASTPCLLFCDSVPQALRSGESRALTAKEFMMQMSVLIVNHAGVSTKELIDLLPTYQYEKVTNTVNLNGYTGKSVFRLFSKHHGHGASVSQSRTMEYKKNLYEADELTKIFEDGTALVYVAPTNAVFLAQIL